MIKAVAFDMDGVLRIGSEPIEGVNKVFETLKENGIKVMISTNECRYSPEELRDDLHEMGINVGEDVPIYTAGLAVKDYIEKKLERFSSAKFSLGIVGETGLFRVLSELSERENCKILEVPPTYKTRLYLVIGTVDKIKISTLEKVRKWINAGAQIITTCCDMSDPSSKGDFTLGMPNHILHMASFNTLNYTKPYSTGKPNPIHAKAILRQFRSEDSTIDANEILFVGDTIYTDIQLAEESGFKSALVLSGNTKEDAIKKTVVESDFIIKSIRDIPDLILRDNAVD